MNWSGLRTRPMPCPECGAPWKATEITGAAHRGGGYRIMCHSCEHRWDDPHATYEERRVARRNPPADHNPPVTWADIIGVFIHGGDDVRSHGKMVAGYSMHSDGSERWWEKDPSAPTWDHVTTVANGDGTFRRYVNGEEVGTT